MHCPSCGKKLAMTDLEEHNYGTFTEDDIYYRCDDCEVTWLSTYSTMDQECIIKPVNE